MIARTLFAAFGALTMFFAVTMSALAWSEDVQGRPDLNHDSPVGYYLWHDDNGMHLRTHGPGDEHSFLARLTTDGVFVDVDTVRLESADDYAVLDGGHTLVLRFKTYDATDGVNFRIQGGTKLRLRLGLNGELIETDSIYLGPNGKHPRTNPFTLSR